VYYSRQDSQKKEAELSKESQRNAEEEDIIEKTARDYNEEN